MQIQLDQFQDGKPLKVQEQAFNEQISKLRAQNKFQQIYQLASKLKDKEKYLVRANALYHMKKWNKLQQCCEKGLKVSQESEFYNYRGRVAGVNGDHKNKVALTKRAIILDPYIPAYHRNLGSAYYRLKDYQKAVEAHNAAIDLEPKNSVNYHNRGAALFRMRRFQQAKQSFKMAIKKDKKTALAYSWLGDCEKQLGDKEKAIQFYQQAFEISGNEYFIKEKVNPLKQQKSGILGKISKIFK